MFYELKIILNKPSRNLRGSKLQDVCYRNDRGVYHFPCFNQLSVIEKRDEDVEIINFSNKKKIKKQPHCLTSATIVLSLSYLLED